MSNRPTEDTTILASVLDRLLDDTPGAAVDQPKRPGQALRELKEAVRRDLEHLLNTRRPPVKIPPGFKQLDRSLVSYGIPDFAGVREDVQRDTRQLARLIEKAIRDFEPRLTDIRVEPVEGDSELDRTLRFQIRATLQVAPIHDPVAFQSIIEPTTGNFQVGSARA
jgi:type VI secretion system protein ImpF